jgi:pyridoxine/pyridoxamine 5'-phosphate oxidase
MPKNELFIEYREEEGDYAVRRPSASRASATAPTQAEAIDIAMEMEPEAAILVERVRNTDAGGRDKWRTP